LAARGAPAEPWRPSVAAAAADGAAVFVLEEGQECEGDSH